MQTQLRKRLKAKKSESGFTIIEVLIVLAIAGLILLIVFLAVPALQRNSRNTQRKNDVAAVLGAINEYSNNNNGAPVNNALFLAAAMTNANLNIYKGQVTWADGSSLAVAANNNPGTVVVASGAKCGAAGASAPATSRQYAVLYAVETGAGAPQPTCTDS